METGHCVAFVHFEFFKIRHLRGKGIKGAVSGCWRIPAAVARRLPAVGTGYGIKDQHFEGIERHWLGGAGLEFEGLDTLVLVWRA